MKIKIITNFGSFIINLPESKPNYFTINEYSEEIVECYK